MNRTIASLVALTLIGPPACSGGTAPPASVAPAAAPPAGAPPTVALAAPTTSAAPAPAAAPATAPAAAAPATQPQRRGPTVYRMTVHPRAVEPPALHYRLLPEPADQTRGNAAQIYLLAFGLSAQEHMEAEKIPAGTPTTLPDGSDATGLDDLYLHLPLNDLPQQAVEQYLGSFGGMLSFLDQAAQRDHCDWDLDLREQGFAALLPHLNHARGAANHMAIRARLQIARHDWAGAARSLRSGFALGRSFNAQAVLVQALVGLGIDGISLARVEEWVQQPGAPNLYWDLATLPRPMIDVAESLRWERAMVFATFPQLKKVRDGTFGDQDWRDMMNSMATKLEGAPPQPVNPLASSLGPAGAGMLIYPRAKQYLLDHGTTQQQVDAMPVPLVLGRYILGSYEEWSDEVLKWSGSPYWQAGPGLHRSYEAFAHSPDKNGGNFLLLVMPSLERTLFTGVRTERQVSALQTIEALRDYAAGHDGRPPASLAALADTPAPLDPVTGKAFDYTVDGNRATLASPAPAHEAPQLGVRYEVTFER